ncbi:ATP synthase F1 subunit delta [Salsipaludibacter albus]|uniref:ATP synthase F1 subunit delta n=1 Tax=Salsipaludibacter albus TaxID=2849650 RepID=UPI001EE47366|nr:ATP synthase F1 subunit delta [Salsipaludibacter albus]MBY5163359.1 ATP synthase F1 subunit delta [Salsipaludibacter albus]
MTTSTAFADAIVALADGAGTLDVVDTELTTIARAVDANPDLYERLVDVQLPASQRLKFVESETLAAASPMTRAALAMVITGEGAGDITEIASRVSDAASAKRSREVAEVTVAAPLDDASREKLRTALERATGKSLDLKVQVDPSVVGGVRARIGDTVIDGSVAGRLAAVRTALSA